MSVLLLQYCHISFPSHYQIISRLYMAIVGHVSYAVSLFHCVVPLEEAPIKINGKLNKKIIHTPS
jgi:hypothetical protein